jgi:hypothetical protein
MATKTLGTLATNTLTGVQMPPDYNATPWISDADFATIANSIFDDERNPQQLLNQAILNGSFSRKGLLVIPNRGVLEVKAGDWVAVDPNGWPILIGRESLPQTLTATGNTNTSPALTNLSVNVLALGWWAGMAITGTNIPANTVIWAIASNGLSLTLSKAATGSTAGSTFTVGSWTHS